MDHVEHTAVEVLQRLSAVPDDDAREAYDTALKDAYWKQRSLHLVVAIGYASVDRLLVQAANATSPEAANDALSGVKAALYNVASFTWPGWDEADIDVSPAEAAAGLDAARANLAYAELLDKGDLAVARANWMLGAHQLTAASYGEARSSFTAAAEAADKAGSDADSAVARAFGFLTEVAAGDTDAEPRLSESLEHLGSLDDGEKFVDQVLTARLVISR